MPQKVINFSGINRQVNEFQNVGHCDELINLRPSSSGAKVVKEKKQIINGINGFKSVTEHKFGAQSNFIAITDSTVIWLSDAGDTKQVLMSDVSARYVSFAGNVLLVTCENYQQMAFKFKDGGYTEFSTSLPDIDISVELENFDASATYTSDSSFHNVGEAREGLAKAYSLFYNTYHHGLASPIVVGCTFELEDGSEVWSTGFSIIDPTKDVRYKASSGSGVVSVTANGAEKATLKFRVSNFLNVSGVKSIRFYSSLPQTPYDMEESTGAYYANKLSNTDINLAGQPMYLQKIVPFGGYGEFLLNTEYKLAAEPLMPVTSGIISRSGDAVSYNNRFHYYNSNVEHPLQQMSSGVHSNVQRPAEDNYTDVRRARLYVVIDNGDERIFAYDSIPDVIMYSTMDFVYPMGGIKEGYLQTSDDNFSTSSWFKIEFSDSPAYNYSCALDWQMSRNACDKPDITNLYEVHGQMVKLKDESNAINVSAPYNPFVFQVQKSYGFGGEILDVCTAYLPISATQISQFPISVFTTNGIYAIEQGDGNELYGNVLALQPHVISGKALSTPHGTFFISSKNLYLLVGREAVNVSYAVSGERNLDIRNVDAYRKLCCNKNGDLYDFSNALSMLNFEDLINGATLLYDQYNNELIISKSDIRYSYVFNIDTKMYHKVYKKYLKADSNARYVIEETDGVRNLVDMHSETKSMARPVLLQSRPLRFDVFLTHIHRAILNVDTTLASDWGHNLCFSVFASDNLSDWKCIISAQKKDTALSQIRTNRAPKSYRNYVFIINGTVGPDTDIADIIADYTVVSRRLG